MQGLRSKPVLVAIAAVFVVVALYAAARIVGYEAGRDAALRDNRTDAALQARQNVEG